MFFSYHQEADDAKQLELSRSIFMQLQKKLTQLKDQCQELEKKKHMSKTKVFGWRLSFASMLSAVLLSSFSFLYTVEKQIQQTSVIEYVNRKRSAEGNEVIIVFFFCR